MEILVELLLELLIQLFGELFIELGLRSAAAPFRKESSPWLAAPGYALFGAILGGISRLVFPHHMVADMQWRLVNLGVTPIAAGACKGGDKPFLRLFTLLRQPLKDGVSRSKT
jgi:hypothetical protein